LRGLKSSFFRLSTASRDNAILSLVILRDPVHALDSSQPSTQRRRSERISETLPLIIRGIDLLGQPFEERTSTLTLNLHGCRYASRYHLPKNTWVTLEVPQGTESRSVRARVAWIQRPHSVREFFQVAVELESPANIWGLDPLPADWQDAATLRPGATSRPEIDLLVPEGPEARLRSPLSNFAERMGPDMNTPLDASFASSQSLQTESESVPIGESPLLNEWKAELERQANQAAERAAARAGELIQQAAQELDKTRAGAHDAFAAQLAAEQSDFLREVKSEFEGVLGRTREILQELDQRAQALRSEGEAAADSTSRLVQARLQIEAAEAARVQHHEPSPEELHSESAFAEWRNRLASEMGVAQSQWHELLQSSLDSSIERLVAQLSGHSQEVVRAAEQKIAERFAELQEPLGQMSADAREALSGLKAGIEEEISRARSSLAEMEQSAGRLREHSAQLEAASHDTLNELHRRLENILDTQTDEMRRRTSNIVDGAQHTIGQVLDTASRNLIERTVADVESRIEPRIERVSELLRELAPREGQAEESLRLYRERLRQVSENSHREVASQIASTVSNLRNDFEDARREALGKWSEELDAAGVRASHAAAESIGRSSEWFQQEARARLQVQVEQTLATAASSFEEKAAEASQQFEARLAEQSSHGIAQIHQQLDGIAGEVTGRARSEIAAAAEAAASSFGQVLRGISEQEVLSFNNNARTTLSERQQDFERFTHQAMSDLQSNARSSLEAATQNFSDQFRAQMASQLESAVSEGRTALGHEFASALDGYRTERATHEQEWAVRLGRLSDEGAANFEERLRNVSDTWQVSSLRRLNEHGQNAVESLVRSADQAVRDSCSKVFEGLAEMFRDRSTNAAGAVGFIPPPGHEPADSTVPHQQAASNSNA
jgi:hypothetical protein